jgi:hypothetical protein
MTEKAGDFFRQRGFELAFSTHTEDELAVIYKEAAGWSRNKLRTQLQRGVIGPVWADLSAASGIELRGYGTGSTEADAATRAVERWRTEQGD